MSQHMVIFQTADGSPAYSQFESISEAVGFVESLRNDQGIETARMFELKEIKFELKPVFKVELKELTPGSSAPAAATSAPSAASPQAAPAPAATRPAPAPSAPAPAPSAPAPSSPAPSAPAPSAAPVGGTTSFGSGPAPAASPSPEPTTPSAPVPPADQPSGDAPPARRGLFGR